MIFRTVCLVLFATIYFALSWCLENISLRSSSCLTAFGFQYWSLLLQISLLVFLHGHFSFERLIYPSKPLLPLSVTWKTSIYVSYSRFWCFARVLNGDDEDKTSDTVFNSMELRTTVSVALAKLLATKARSSLKLSIVVETGMTLSLFKQLKSILTGLSSETFSSGQSLVNTASFS